MDILIVELGIDKFEEVLDILIVELSYNFLIITSTLVMCSYSTEMASKLV